MKLHSVAAVAVVAFALFLTTTAAVEFEDERVGGFINDFLGYNVTEKYTDSERQGAQSFINLLHKTTRYAIVNGSLKKISSDFCTPKNVSSNGTYSLDDCQWDQYAESLAWGSAASMIIAVFIFPFLFCGICWCRCCCCGKYSATPEPCCGDPAEFNPTFHGYSTGSVWCFFSFAVACSVIILAGGVVASVGSGIISVSAYDAVNFTNFTLFTLSDIMTSVVDVFDKADDDFPNLSSSINMHDLREVANVAKNLTNSSDVIHNTVSLVDLIRMIVMNIFLFLPFILMLLVVISRFCCWGMAWGMAACGFIFTFVSLASFSFVYPLSMGISDGCILVNASLSDPDSDPLITSLFNCSEGSAIAELTDMADKVIDSAASYGCSFFEEVESLKIPCDSKGNDTIILDDPSYLCPVMKLPSHADDCNSSTLRNLTRDTRIYNWSIGCFCPESGTTYKRNTKYECGEIHELNDTRCSDLGEGCQAFYCYGDKDKNQVTIGECKDSCSDKNVASSAYYVFGYSNVMAGIMEIYQTKIKPYLNCETFDEILTFGKEYVCVGIINSFSLTYIGEIISAVGCFIGTFVALFGMKRFNKANRRDYAGRVHHGRIDSNREELSSLLDREVRETPY